MNINLFKKINIVAALGFLPMVTFAQATFRSAVEAAVTTIGDYLMPLLFSAALALFIWGIADFIRHADNPEERSKGKSRILWGLIALFVMVGYLGLTALLKNTFFDGGLFLPQLYTE